MPLFRLAALATSAAAALGPGPAAALAAAELVWSSTDVDGGFGPDATGAPLDVVLDAAHRPHLFYTASFSLPHDYKYATTTAAGKWTTETVDSYPEHFGTFDADAHLVLDSKGGVHVLYTKEGVDPSPCAGCSSCGQCSGAPPACCSSDPDCCDGPMWGELWYASRSTNGTWTPTLIDRGYRLNSTDARPMDCSIALDADDVPHVAYYLELPKRQLMWATPAAGRRGGGNSPGDTATESAWQSQVVATDGGYDNHISIANGLPLIVYWSEECFCVRLWSQAPGGSNATGTVGEGPNTGETAQGYGIDTAVRPDGSELLVTFTRNVYGDKSLRAATVPLLPGGGVGPLPTTSVPLQDAARASATAVAFVPPAAAAVVAAADGGHGGGVAAAAATSAIVAYSFGTADGDPFEVRTTSGQQQLQQLQQEREQGAGRLAQAGLATTGTWSAPLTVPATSINGTGGLEMAAAVGLSCCDARGRPVLAYTRRPSMYESFLAYATLEDGNRSVTAATPAAVAGASSSPSTSTTSARAPPAPLPRLAIDPEKISISGLSSGADFTVQQMVAYSSLYCGAGVFAGQTYRCAVVRFPADVLTPPNPSVPICEGCPAHSTLVYDHCKNHPKAVVTPTLTKAARDAAARGDIDDVRHLAKARIYLYRGTEDATYLNGSVQLVSDFFASFLDEPATQILFNRTTPSAHCWPTDDWGTPCGTGVIENCGYDGPAAALNHIYGGLPNPPAAEYNPASLRAFDQRPFFGANDTITGLNTTGFVYVPAACTKHNGTACGLHVSLHGCNVNGYYDDAVHRLSFTRWAETNSLVVLFPRMAGHDATVQERDGCWDAYAQTGAEYAYKKGVQMTALRDMVRAVAGV